MVHEELFSFLFKAGTPAGEIYQQQSSCEWIKLIDQAFRVIKYSRGHIILHIGQTPEHIYFMQQGAVSGHYYDPDGRQYALYLWSGLSVITDIAAYMDKRPSELQIEICDKTEIIAIHRSALDKIIKQHPEAYLFLNVILDHFLNYHRERDMDSQSLYATVRLQKLLEADSKLSLKFSSKSIGSLIGISAARIYDLIKINRK
jgi:CRP-like cAMP-binding protein